MARTPVLGALTRQQKMDIIDKYIQAVQRDTLENGHTRTPPITSKATLNEMADSLNDAWIAWFPSLLAHMPSNIMARASREDHIKFFRAFFHTVYGDR